MVGAVPNDFGGPHHARSPRSLVLHAMSSPALDPPFVGAMVLTPGLSGVYRFIPPFRLLVGRHAKSSSGISVLSTGWLCSSNSRRSSNHTGLRGAIAAARTSATTRAIAPISRIGIMTTRPNMRAAIKHGGARYPRRAASAMKCFTPREVMRRPLRHGGRTSGELNGSVR